MIGKIEGDGWLREGDAMESRPEVIRGKIEMHMCCRSKMSMIHLLLHSRKFQHEFSQAAAQFLIVLLGIVLLVLPSLQKSSNSTNCNP
jgi:hypothetical protein